MLIKMNFLKLKENKKLWFLMRNFDIFFFEKFCFSTTIKKTRERIITI